MIGAYHPSEGRRGRTPLTPAYDFFAEALASSSNAPAGTFNAFAILSKMTTVGFRTPRSMPLM